MHLENSITQHRPIGLDEQLQVTARPANLRAHPKGRAFDMLTTVALARRAGVGGDLDLPAPRAAATDDAPAGATFPDAPPQRHSPGSCPADLGRRYAGVSGDHNPIHLYPLTAKAFGFPRQIAHGMWSMARCVGALENRLPDAVTRRRGVQEADPAARLGGLRRPRLDAPDGRAGRSRSAPRPRAARPVTSAGSGSPPDVAVGGQA